MSKGLSSFLGGVADGPVLDPLMDVANAVSYRSGGDFDEFRAATAVSPVLKCSGGIAEQFCGFVFVDQAVEIYDFVFKFVVLVHCCFPFIEREYLPCSEGRSAEYNRIDGMN